MKQARALLPLVLLSSLCFSSIQANRSGPEPDGWLSDLPTLFRAGSGFACSIGAAAAFIASAYILAQQHKINKVNKIETSYVPPREFWWSTSTGCALLVALYILTATDWSKQT